MTKAELDALADALARRHIHAAWFEVGKTFFKQGFGFGYHLAKKTSREFLPLIAGGGFLVGYVLGRALGGG